MAFPDYASVVDDLLRDPPESPINMNWDGWYEIPGLAGLPLYTGSAVADGEGSGSFWNTATTDGNQEAFVTLTQLPDADGHQFRLYLRVQNPTTEFTGYCVLIQYDTDQFKWRLRSINAGLEYSRTALAAFPATLTAGDKVGIKVMGYTLSAWFYHGGAWTQLGTDWDDSENANKIAAGTDYAVLFTSDATVKFTDFGLGSWTSGATNYDCNADAGEYVVTGADTGLIHTSIGWLRYARPA